AGSGGDVGDGPEVDALRDLDDLVDAGIHLAAAREDAAVDTGLPVALRVLGGGRGGVGRTAAARCRAHSTGRRDVGVVDPRSREPLVVERVERATVVEVVRR